ncbi:hypothetical protein V6N12_065197 [Hibiscus sabdariffa]|uniref:Jasmonate O-methyltransferase n=1 Tax=Hibiscus sabdariffa TaxID=183260 RepID=A0ABR2G7Z8_9ROSI
MKARREGSDFKANSLIFVTARRFATRRIRPEGSEFKYLRRYIKAALRFALNIYTTDKVQGKAIKMQIMQALDMNKGNGDTSYAKTPRFSNVVDLESMGIADLGCSSGPNTLSVISEIMDTVEAANRRLGRRLVSELRVFLNDLYSNDFNEVFMSLPAFYNRLKEEKGIGFGSVFVSGVPGSFYGRLFPTNSLHFVHSSSSLHWLSQVPAGLDSKALKCVNKGKLFISKSSPQIVMDAYSLQFRNDFSLFIRSRSQELVPGGRLVLSFLGRKSADATTQDSCYHWELLAQAIMSLAREGRIEEEKVDSFNAPYYAPCTEEIKEEIQKEGSFTIDGLEAFEIDWDGGVVTDIHTPQGKQLVGQRVAKTIRAVVESMLESHFGIEPDVMDELFIRYADIVGTHLSQSRTKYINLVTGRIEEEKVDSFNAPYYAPCTEEIKEEIQKEGSFTIDGLEAFEIDWDGGVVTDIHTPQGKQLVGQRVAKTIRAVVESMLESHFGIEPDVMDELFIRYENCFKTNIFRETHVFVRSTASAKTIPNKKLERFTKRYIKSIAELVGNRSLLCASPHHHKLLCDRLVNFFSSNFVSLLVKLFDPLIVDALNAWEDGVTVIVLDEALKITFKAMCKMLLSLESGAELESLHEDHMDSK